MTQKIKVDGMRELKRQLRRVEKVTRAELRDRVRQRAQEARDRARDLAPVEAGELRDGLQVRPTADGAALVANADHTIHVEFGTAEQSPQPMLRPAVREATTNLNRDVERVARQLEGL